MTFLTTAIYCPPTGPNCDDVVYQANVTVQLTGSGWSISSCTGCTTAPFNQVGICDDGPCTNSPQNSYQYILKVDLDNPDGTLANNNLRAVTYDTTSVDNGDTVVDCERIDAVTPTSQVFSATDTTFPCSYDCTSSIDTTMFITYE